MGTSDALVRATEEQNKQLMKQLMDKEAKLADNEKTIQELEFKCRVERQDAQKVESQLRQAEDELKMLRETRLDTSELIEKSTAAKDVLLENRMLKEELARAMQTSSASVESYSDVAFDAAGKVKDMETELNRVHRFYEGQIRRNGELVSHLESQVENLRMGETSELVSMKTEREKLMKTLTDMQAAHEEQKTMLEETLKKHSVESSEMIKSFERRAMTMEKELNSQHSHLETQLKHERTRRERAEDGYKQQITDLMAQLEKWEGSKKEMQEMEEELERRKQAMNEAIATSKRLEVKLRAFEGQGGDMPRLLDASNTKIRALEEELASQHKHFTEQIHALEEAQKDDPMAKMREALEKHGASGIHQLMEEEKQGLHKEIAKLKVEIHDAQDTHKVADRKMRQLEQELAKQSASSDTRETDLQSEIKRLRVELDLAQEEAKTANNRFYGLQSASKANNEQADNVALELSGKERDGARRAAMLEQELKKQATYYEKETKELQKQMKGLEDRVKEGDGWRSKAYQYESRINQLEATLRQTSQGVASSVKQTHYETESKVKILEAELQRQSEYSKQEEQQLRARIATLEGDLSRWKNMSESTYHEVVQDRTESVAKLSEEVRMKKEDALKWKTIADEGFNQIQSLKKEIEIIEKQHLDDSQAKQAVIAELQAIINRNPQAKQIERQLADHISYAAEEKAQLEASQRGMQRTIARLESELASERSNLKDTMGVVTQLRTELHHQQMHSDSLLNATQSGASDLQRRFAKLEEEHSELSLKFKESDQRLRLEIQKLQQEKEAYLKDNTIEVEASEKIQALQFELQQQEEFGRQEAAKQVGALRRELTLESETEIAKVREQTARETADRVRREMKQALETELRESFEKEIRAQQILFADRLNIKPDEYSNEKEMERLQLEIVDLKDQVEDLKDQNLALRTQVKRGVPSAMSGRSPTPNTRTAPAGVTRGATASPPMSATPTSSRPQPRPQSQARTPVRSTTPGTAGGVSGPDVAKPTTPTGGQTSPPLDLQRNVKDIVDLETVQEVDRLLGELKDVRTTPDALNSLVKLCSDQIHGQRARISVGRRAAVAVEALSANLNVALMARDSPQIRTILHLFSWFAMEEETRLEMMNQKVLSKVKVMLSQNEDLPSRLEALRVVAEFSASADRRLFGVVETDNILQTGLLLMDDVDLSVRMLAAKFLSNLSSREYNAEKLSLNPKTIPILVRGVGEYSNFNKSAHSQELTDRIRYSTFGLHMLCKFSSVHERAVSSGAIGYLIPLVGSTDSDTQTYASHILMNLSAVTDDDLHAKFEMSEGGAVANLLNNLPELGELGGSAESTKAKYMLCTLCNLANTGDNKQIILQKQAIESICLPYLQAADNEVVEQALRLIALTYLATDSAQRGSIRHKLFAGSMSDLFSVLRNSNNTKVISRASNAMSILCRDPYILEHFHNLLKEEDLLERIAENVSVGLGEATGTGTVNDAFQYPSHLKASLIMLDWMAREEESRARLLEDSSLLYTLCQLLMRGFPTATHEVSDGDALYSKLSLKAMRWICESDGAQVAVATHGAIPYAVQSLQVRNSELIALELLELLARPDSNQPELKSERVDCVGNVTPFLNSTPKLAEGALRVLCSFCDRNANSRLVVGSSKGVVDKCFQFLTDEVYLREEKLRRSSAKLLYFISLDDTAVAHVRKTGRVELLMDTLGVAVDAELKQHLMGILLSVLNHTKASGSNLAGSGVLPSLNDAGANVSVEVMLKMARKRQIIHKIIDGIGTPKLDVVRQSLLALMAFYEDPKIKEQVDESTRVVPLLVFHVRSRDREVQDMALASLAMLAESYEMRSAMLDKQVIEILYRFSLTAEPDMRIRAEHVVSLLANDSRFEYQIARAKAGKFQFSTGQSLKNAATKIKAANALRKSVSPSNLASQVQAASATSSGVGAARGGDGPITPRSVGDTGSNQRQTPTGQNQQQGRPPPPYRPSPSPQGGSAGSDNGLGGTPRKKRWSIFGRKGSKDQVTQ